MISTSMGRPMQVETEFADATRYSVVKRILHVEELTTRERSYIVTYGVNVSLLNVTSFLTSSDWPQRILSHQHSEHGRV